MSHCHETIYICIGILLPCSDRIVCQLPWSRLFEVMVCSLISPFHNLVQYWWMWYTGAASSWYQSGKRWYSYTLYLYLHTACHMTRQHASPGGMVIVILARLACLTPNILNNHADILVGCWTCFVVRWIPHITTLIYVGPVLDNTSDKLSPKWIAVFCEHFEAFFQQKWH